MVIVAFILVALNASAANSNPMETVVVAGKDLKPRVAITADDLSTSVVPTGRWAVYFSHKEDVVGMVPLVSIPSGHAITSDDVVKASQALGAQSQYLQIPKGYVALTIPTSEQQGVGDYIQPGDYIAVIATVSSGTKVASLTVFTQVHVLKVGTQAGAGGASATSLTIEVTQCQAEYITWFLAYASLKYTLESYRDYMPGDQAPDPQCPNVTSAKGVTLPLVKASFPSLF